MTAPVDARLDRIEKDAHRLGVSLSLLAADLLRGRGVPHPHEMTPDQYARLAGILTPLGELGGLILRADVLLTSAREDPAAAEAAREVDPILCAVGHHQPGCPHDPEARRTH